MNLKMKRYLYILLTVLAVLSCEKDGDRLIASLDGDSTAQVKSFSEKIVLSNEVNSKLMLTLYWDEAGSFSLNNPQAAVPEGILLNSVQFSSDADFTSVYDHQLAPGSLSAQFTGSQLNVILTRLGLEAGVEHEVYIRLKTSLGSNTEPRYGEATVIKATGFHIDMSVVKLLSSDKASIIGNIPEIKTDEYAGFVYTASGWLNFWFEEGDGTIWGTANDGTNGTPFMMSKDASAWNNWFPAPQGLYLVTMNTSTSAWTATAIAEMTVSVDSQQSAMTYSSADNTWGCILDIPSAGTEILLQQSGNRYDQGTGDAAYNEVIISFVTEDKGSLIFGEGALKSGLKAKNSGKHTLFLNFDKMEWELLEGEHEIGEDTPEEPEPDIPIDPDKVYEEFLYCHYAWDSATYWQEKNAATLRSPAKDGIYTGYVSTPDDWALKPYTNFVFSSSLTCNDDAAITYGCNSSDNSSLVSPATNGWTCWVDALGLTFITVDLRTMKWTKESLGFPTVNDTQMTFSTESVRWSATCQVNGSGLTFRIGDKTITENAESGTYEVSLDLRDAADIKFELKKL